MTRDVVTEALVQLGVDEANMPATPDERLQMLVAEALSWRDMARGLTDELTAAAEELVRLRDPGDA